MAPTLPLIAALACALPATADAQDRLRPTARPQIERLEPITPLTERLRPVTPQIDRPQLDINILNVTAEFKDTIRQLPTGIIEVKPRRGAPATKCDVAAELQGRAVKTEKGSLPLLSRTPCDVIRQNLLEQAKRVTPGDGGDLKVVTKTEANVFATNKQLRALLPEGATLAPLATKTDEGVEYNLILPDDPDRLARVKLQAIEPIGPNRRPRIEVTVEEPDTEPFIAFMTVEPVADVRHAADLVVDADDLNPDAIPGLENAEACIDNSVGLQQNCFGASVAIEKALDGETHETFGSAVLLNAEHGLYLTAWHVVEDNKGVFSTAGGTSAKGYVNARYKYATNATGELTIETVDERYEIQKTSAATVTVAPNFAMDLFLFRAVPVDPDFEDSMIAEARILTSPSDMTLRDETGAHTVGVGYGGTINQGGTGVGERRFSRLAVGDCGATGDLSCVGPEWLVAGRRGNDPDSADHAACPSDSGSPLFVEVLPDFDVTDAPRIASVGVLSARMTPEFTLAATSEDFCSAGLQYTDLTHPTVQAWIISQAAMLTNMSEADVVATMFVDRDVVLTPSLVADLGLN